jgi:hypothetical protein
MPIEKALNPAPLGLDALMDEGPVEPDLEIEIEDPEALSISIGGEEIFSMEEGEEEGFSDNLAEYLSEGELSTIANDLIGDVEDDVSSRKDWIQTYVDGLQLLGLKIEERTEPWEGACGIYHPMLAEALVKFQSETMMSTFPAAGPVKTVIIGKETPAKKASAERVKDDMNYQLTEEMPEYRPEHERMLWGLGLAGNAFKKVYYDPSLERQVSMYVPAEDLVVPYGAASLEAAERVTHVMRKTENELRKLQVAGFYRDIDLGTPDNTLDEVEKKIAEKLGFKATTDSRYKLMEINVNLDLPGFEHKDEESDEETGIALPYIVTVEKGSQKVLAIRRNWNPDDKTFTKRQHFVHYGYIPGFGFYHFGLIHLIGAYAKSGTSIIRQLVDAGSLANLPGGFKTRGLRIKGDDTPIAPGEFRDVDVPSGAMKDNGMTLPYKEPSQVLMALLGQIVEEGRRFANTADMQVSDMSSQAPVGTTLAILERTLKVMSAVQARIHYSLKRELKLLKKIIADYTPEEYDYEPTEGSRRAKKSDYDNVDVIPVSDPNASTMAQKIVQYQAALQLAQTAPQLYNLPLLHRQMLDVLGIKDAQKLVPMDEDQKPTDPVSENQNILKNKPVKAFLAQDHAAHIAVHMSMAKDPKIQALVKNVPQLAQQLEAALMAHVFEHLGMQYRGEIEKQLGMTLPPQHDENGEDITMPPDVEARLSPLLAQAAAQLVQQNSAQAAQQQAQQQAQDPIIQMQMQELQIKAQDQQRKAQKDMADIQLEQQRLGLERERMQMQVQTDIAKTMANTQKDKEQMAIDLMKYQKDKEHDSLKQEKQLLAQGLQQAHQFADSEENRKHQSEISKQKFEKPEVKEKKGK